MESLILAALLMPREYFVRSMTESAVGLTAFGHLLFRDIGSHVPRIG